MGEQRIDAEGEVAHTMPSKRMPRSQTSLALPTSRQQNPARVKSERPATATGCHTQPTRPTLSRLESKADTDSHTPKWNQSTKVDKSLITGTPTPTTSKFVARPLTSKKKVMTIPSVVADLLTVRALYDGSRDAGYLTTQPSRNTAVQAAFDKAINHREVNSDRLRTGLITNDMTPRAYLQESQGTRQFKRMNLKLREQLTDAYNYKCLHNSLPHSGPLSSLSSDTDSSDARSVDSRSRVTWHH